MVQEGRIWFNTSYLIQCSLKIKLDSLGVVSFLLWEILKNRLAKILPRGPGFLSL